MYLKSIRAQGFKTFADKLDLEINPGITGIVGPNGSGKSNIVDAVRWVLGEQSAKSLRGANMSDVIFNGSSSRDAHKRAMVALVFDNSDHYLNSDFNEIEVKRVVYKTGENEYFLNNTRVRLKDVLDLFMESGAGSGAYNIISQGNVTDIVNSKSEDRRIIFESTAKVLKYKKRKEESIRKLDKTEENLLRIDLVIKELLTTLEPLKEQSKQAQKHIEIKKELENMDIALMCKDISALNEKYQTLKKEIEVLNNNLATYQNTSDEAALEKLKFESISLDDKLNTSHNTLLDLTKKLSDLNNEKQLTIERQKYTLNQNNIDNNLVNLKKEQLSLSKNIEILKEEIKTLEATIKENNTLKEEVTNELLKYQVKRTNITQEIQNKNKDVFIIQNKIEILENNMATTATSPLSVRSVLNNPRLKGIHNTIGTLIDCPDKYMVALDTALGYSKNYLVVDTEEDAIAAINYLKEKKQGRATFYPLNVIKSRLINNEALTKVKTIKGFVGVLSSLVHFDSIYQNIMENQLGNVLVVKDASTLTMIGKLLDYKYKVVSLDGEIQNVGGSITGGTSKSNNILNEKNELRKLKSNLNDLNVEIKALNENVTTINKTIMDLEQKENSYRLTLASDNEIVSSKNAQLSTLEDELNVKISELEGISSLKDNTLNDKLMTLMEEANVISQDKELLEKQINSFTQNKNDIQEEINILEKKVKENNSLFNSKQNEINAKEIELGKTEVKLDNLLVNLNEEYNLTFEYAYLNYELDIDDTVAREKVEVLKKELAKLGEVNLGSIAEFERLNKRYEFLTSQKADLEKASLELKDIIAEMDDIMVSKFKSTFDEVQKEFSRIFTLMFKGGQGKLLLSNPDDLLHTGIDIVAIPPGKKVNSPLSLSGGEKALTAICLLFAILEVNPAPFIILDEAEAALDEANVDMFGKYLNNEKNKSQFIVITHKKRMMEYADSLYGITMQESGVSKIVSTKLEK